MEAQTHRLSASTTAHEGSSPRLATSTTADLMRASRCLQDHLTHEEESHRGGVGGGVRINSARSYRGIIKLPTRTRHRRLDLKVYPREQYADALSSRTPLAHVACPSPFSPPMVPCGRYAYALLYFTGSDHFNRSMRHYAKQRGYSLSDHGIVHSVKGYGGDNIVRGITNLFPARCEADIFAALSLHYVGPTKRNTDVCEISAPMIGTSAPEGGVVPATTDGLLE